MTERQSERLRRRVELVLPDLMKTTSEIYTHPLVPEIYPEYLFTLHCISRASVPLMEAALDCARRRADTDAVSEKMVPYLIRHIPEEMHAHWLLEDLEVLGFDRSQILARSPSPRVAALVGSQYYWIFHHHPVALFGYMELVEGYPPNVIEIEKLIAATGYPREAFRSLLRHAEIDQLHRDDLHKVLDDLPMARHHWLTTSISAIQTVHLANAALHEIVEQ